MNLFDRIIVQPLFNLLLAIYALVGDFGIAIIILGVLVRIVLWPLMKRQLHQTRLMRKVQPEVKKIKARAKGNRTLESQLTMELYKERGIKLSTSLWITAIQLPILLALFNVLRTITQHRNQIDSYAYSFWHGVAPIQAILANPQHFNERLFGVIDLTQTAKTSAVIAILLVITALLQYVQSKQIMPAPEAGRKLRDVLRDQSAGKEVDQSELSSLLSQRLILVLPVLVLVFGLVFALPGALVLYYVVQSIVAIILQRYYLKKDANELIATTDAPTPSGKKATAKARARVAREASIVKEKS